MWQGMFCSSGLVKSRVGRPAGKLSQTLMDVPGKALSEGLEDWSVLHFIRLLMSHSWAAGCLPGHRQTNPAPVSPVCQDSGYDTIQTLSVDFISSKRTSTVLSVMLA